MFDPELGFDPQERWPGLSRDAVAQNKRDILEKRERHQTNIAAQATAADVSKQWQDYIAGQIDEALSETWDNLEAEVTKYFALKSDLDALRADIKTEIRDMGNRLRAEFHTQVRANLNKLIVLDNTDKTRTKQIRDDAAEVIDWNDRKRA